MPRQPKLPAEILHMICAASDYATLPRLSLVSRALHTIVEEYLWAEFKCEGTSSLIPFIRSIRGRPELSLLVKHVNIRLSGNAPSYENPARCPPIKVPESAVRMLVTATPAIDSQWASLIIAGDPGAFIALVISLLPNLITIRIHTRSMDDLDMLCHHFHLTCNSEHHAAQLAARSQEDSPQTLSPPVLSPWPTWAAGPDPFSAYQHLREVHIISNDRIPEVPFKGSPTHKGNFLGLFYLPSLEHITAPIDTGRWELDWEHPNPPKAVHIKSLDLTVVSEESLRPILDATPSLEKLVRDWGPKFYDNFDSGQRKILWLIQVREGLLKVSHTLKHLEITASSQRWAPHFEEPEKFAWIAHDGDYAIFKALNNLETLQVPFVFLLGFFGDRGRRLSLDGLLPSELEHLTINDCLINIFYPAYRGWHYEDFIEILRSYLSNWASITPRLRSLRLRFNFQDTSWVPQSILDLATDAGIDFQVEYRRDIVMEKKTISYMASKYEYHEGQSRNFNV
ncbi:hypothetical protein N7452_000573 [Penicillium brevicompactum]|uniref:F-box domain-containing protein n=1 Tax=Penicillium brevicompactum TaxID=5074 RepID=A0A9W9R2Y0_PENBR|nr:hypothetical protein N7452_000573 [Penicillium brevicompactum]